MTPTIGRTVRYTLNEGDVALIDATIPREVPRADGLGNRVRRNPVRVGQEYPALIVETFSGTTVNLQVFLDGDCSYWATSRQLAEDPQAEPGAGKWHWPVRV